MRLAISLATLAVFAGPLVSLFGDDSPAPMIDDTHDLVQPTLDPGLQRIGAVRPRGARKVGRSNLAIGCEMLDNIRTAEIADRSEAIYGVRFGASGLPTTACCCSPRAELDE